MAQKFEYKVIVAGRAQIGGEEEMLSQAGEDGWELVAVLATGQGAEPQARAIQAAEWHRFYFKRDKQADRTNAA